jgi:hypothetical protein
MLILGILLELSLTVPITNSLAFLFTVLGEWVVEKKVIGRGMIIGSGGLMKSYADLVL